MAAGVALGAVVAKGVGVSSKGMGTGVVAAVPHPIRRQAKSPNIKILGFVTLAK